MAAVVARWLAEHARLSGHAAPGLPVWALKPGSLTALAIAVRARLEDQTLLAELSGYSEYASRTRHRLVPGVR